MKFHVKSFCFFSIILLDWFVSNRLTIAQSIQTDGTTPTQPASCSGNCTIEGGLQQGNNLFHSFERFNVDADATVLLQDPGVANILGRVTGNELSKILGTLGVSSGDANLFLINPNGIIFGSDSSLDINGSFLATTANAIRFGEYGLLDTAAAEIPLLTIAPSALSFTAENRGSIVSRSSPSAGENPINLETFGLRVPDGDSLLLVGGDVVVDSGSITALEGLIELGGLTEAGEIKLNIGNEKQGYISLDFPEQPSRANVTLTNGTFINVFSADNGGDIAINAGNIIISEGSRVVAGINGELTSPNSQGGNIILNATEKIEINNFSAVANQVFSPETQGNAGDINIDSDSLFISNGSRVIASTLGQGNAGSIEILVEQDFVIASSSAILSAVDSEGVGSAGNISIEADSVFLDSGSQLVSNVFGQGNGGNIFLNVTNLVNITGFGTDSFSSGIVTATEEGGAGKAGNITIDTNNFQIVNGGIVSSQTLNGSDGGNISIDANTFEAVNGGQIVSSAASSGDAGNINIKSSNNIFILGSDSNFASRLAEFGDFGNEAPGNSGFFANVRPEASGAGGDINVAAGQLSIEDSAEINVSAAGTGAAGSLSIDAQDVSLNSGSLTAETTVGSQGNITLNNADTLLLNNNSQITTNAFQSATGGDVGISSEGIALLDDSDITANAVRGQGGNIQITTQGLFQEPNSNITAASELGIDGTVRINNLDRDPSSGIFELPDVPLDPENILAQNLCRPEDNKIANGSSFVITGRGGIAPTSEESLENRDRLVNWATREDLEVSNNGAVGIRQREEPEVTDKSYPKIQQARGLLVAADGTTWLTANASNEASQNSKMHPDCNTSK